MEVPFPGDYAIDVRRAGGSSGRRAAQECRLVGIANDGVVLHSGCTFPRAVRSQLIDRGAGPGGDIDIDGASGPLDFDNATGEARSSIELWRIAGRKFETVTIVPP